MEEIEDQLADNLQTADGNGGCQIAGEKPRQESRVERRNYAPGGRLAGTAPSTLLPLAILGRNVPSHLRPTAFVKEVEHHLGDNFSNGNVGRSLKRFTVAALVAEQRANIGDNQPRQHQRVECADDTPKQSLSGRTFS